MAILSTVINKISKLSYRVFLMIFGCIIIPVFMIFGYMRYSYETFIQQEVSTKIIQAISKSEEEINLTFQRMANASNILVSDQQLIHAFIDNSNDFYRNTVIFDDVIDKLTIYNLFDMDDIIITIFDKNGQAYSNWSTNFNNYEFLLKQNWVQGSIQQKGHITWSMFSPAFIKEDKTSDRYISLARSILTEGTSGDFLATLIISIRQDALSRLLLKYSYDERDCIFICGNNGEVILKHDDDNLFSEQKIKDLYIQNRDKKSGSTKISADKGQYLVSYYSISKPLTFGGQPLKVFHFTSYQGVTNQLSQISQQINVIMLFSFGAIIFIVLFISKQIVKPVKLLSKQMTEYTIDGEITSLNTERSDEIGHLNRSFYKMSQNIKDLFSQLNHEYKVKEKYRFESLRAQLNPHFLFNTLNTIRWMAIIRKADNITESIDALANMLKYSMNRGSELVSLKQELSNIESYVFIQNCRYGDRYKVKFEVEQELLELQVIKFILQPVAENAIIHGFKNSDKAGIIEISGDIQEEKLILCIKDNGRGVDPEILKSLLTIEKDEKSNEKKLTGIGLPNINERIKISCGKEYGLSIYSVLGEGTRVIYKLPVMRGNTPDETNYDS